MSDKTWKEGFESGLTSLCQMLERSANRFGDNTALIFLDKSITYNELRQKVLCMAAALQDIGVKKGDRVAIMLPNSPELVVAYFAVLTNRAEVVLCNPLFTVRELKIQLEDSKTKILVTLDLFWPKARELKEQKILDEVILTTLGPYLSGLKKIIYPVLRRFKGKINFSHGQEAYFFDKLLEDFSNKALPSLKSENRLNDVAAIQYTAGTTGVPQGVMLTHYNLLINTEQVGRWFPEFEIGKERILALLPFFHIFGLTVCLNISVMGSGTLILVPKFSGRKVDALLEVIKKHKPTLFPAVPTIYAAINSFKGIEEYDLSSIKFCISGGAPLPGPVQERFQELTGAVLVEGYGLSEASPVTHCNPLNKEKNKIGSIGLPLPETKARIVDPETGKDLPTGEIGELVIKGPQVMRGYWQNEKETAKALRDGWLYTGDFAKKDEDGYFYIVDRKKDLIIVGGYNVYPREVEEILYTNPKVLEAAVIGVHDDYKGEVVKAIVVLRPEVKAAAEEIREYCRKSLTKYKIPKHIEFRDELPKSIIGKVLKKELKEK